MNLYFLPNVAFKIGLKKYLNPNQNDGGFQFHIKTFWTRHTAFNYCKFTGLKLKKNLKNSLEQEKNVFFCKPYF